MTPSTQVWVVDQAAWDEQVEIEPACDYPITDVHTLCGACGFDFDANGYSNAEMSSHMEAHALAGESSRTYTAPVIVRYEHYDAEYETVHHDEVGHYESQLVKEAYDETVSNGYKCATCGATK